VLEPDATFNLLNIFINLFLGPKNKDTGGKNIMYFPSVGFLYSVYHFFKNSFYPFLACVVFIMFFLQA
jgi:hypothetical protein